MTSTCPICDTPSATQGRLGHIEYAHALVPPGGIFVGTTWTYDDGLLVCIRVGLRVYTLHPSWVTRIGVHRLSYGTTPSGMRIGPVQEGLK